ncbi:unnamed protein product [Phytomonas sp. EM1]|nr:unnamed protein product [Phytomonas sp. EM1]|eukprot:CCW59571.1 unnamed protein product [Phytomonas sp. isolate EM1]
MFSRKINESILRSEGLDLPQKHTGEGPEDEKPYRMTWWWNYVSPKHAEGPRPLVDVSSPFNALDETHQARRFGTQKVGFGHISLNEFIGAYEEVPYTESHHTSEIVRLWMLGLNVWHANLFFAKAQNSFAPTGNPRTKFAWAIVLMMGTIRVNLAGLIGVGGYFYSYEYLYTHGPWPFRIRDPSPNAWKRAWQEGQECYLARAAASVWPALGYAFYMGRWKKSLFWFSFTTFVGMYYEYSRRNISAGTRFFYSYLADRDLQRQAAWGSLAPDLQHRVDPDTNRNNSASQFRYLRITSGHLQNTIWENATHENLPLWRSGKKYPNPYFNWQKAPQNFMDKPYKVKNDLWELPDVMSAKMRSGAQD